MIKLVKLAEPLILRDKKAEWTEAYKMAKATNAPNLDEIKYRYRHPDIKTQLLNETHEKCAYCESVLRHITPGDIEHIKPKSTFDDDIFEWSNLTISCTECNRRKGINYSEKIGIINPYEVDPENHLYALGPMIFPAIGDVAGKIVVELFELNRLPLVERRKDRIDKVQNLIELYASQTDEMLKELYRKKIEKEKNEDKEYSMVARAFIKDCLKHVKKV